MISEKTLRKWRRDALKSIHSEMIDITPEKIVQDIYDRDDRILRLTQELTDFYLMRKE
jgi:hypothetical protein